MIDKAPVSDGDRGFLLAGGANRVQIGLELCSNPRVFIKKYHFKGPECGKPVQSRTYLMGIFSDSRCATR
ncbi:hypothetical protein [Thalassospira sp.]|uniref:hypothetical protein n=1 Tax=Thalassospira sp. TaxID=1912094 RepID=UPI00273346D1|nr:hypothetical protein [Thalassospira sp.]MDP2697076.1 hypothetical protein [Thalassospira sp.]